MRVLCVYSALFTFLRLVHCQPACVFLVCDTEWALCIKYDPKQHKTRKIDAQNMQILLDRWLYYVFDVGSRRNNGFINIISAFLCVVFHASSLVLFQSRSAKPHLLE